MTTNKLWSAAIMLLLAFGMSISISSCGSDGSDPEPTEVNVEIAQCAGYWECKSSIDKVNGETYHDLIKGETLHIKRDGEYGSSSAQLGEGEITKIGTNTFELKNHSGDKYTIKAILNGDKMFLSGKGSGPSTDYEEVIFEYSFEKIEPVEIAQCAGSWECKSSVDKVGDRTYNNLIVGETVHIKKDGEYESSSSQLGGGEIIKKGPNTFEVKNHSGDKYTIKVVLRDNLMMWSGKGSGPSTGYSEVAFEYTLVKTTT